MRAILTLMVCLLSGSSLAYFDEIQGWSVRTGQWDGSARALAGDFNGDGKPDIALIGKGNFCTNNVYVYTSTGSSFVYSVWAVDLQSACQFDDNRWVAGDFNGDGRADLAVIINDGGQNTVRVFPSSGYNFSNSFWTYLYRQGGWDPSYHRWMTGDFDADGKADLAVTWRDEGSTTSITVFTTSRYGVISSVWARKMGGWGDDSRVKWLVGDIDGNGMSDIIGLWKHDGMTSIAGRLSTGFEFIYRDLIFRGGGWADDMPFLAGDFNGDGFSDVATVWNDSWMNSIIGYLSNGQAMFSAGLATRLGGWGDTIKWVAGDFNGDKKTDIVAIWNDGSMNTAAFLPSK